MSNIRPRIKPAPFRGTRMFFDVTKKAKQCLLSGCGVIHFHNNSFCCAEHAREWDKQRKEKIDGMD